MGWGSVDPLVPYMEEVLTADLKSLIKASSVTYALKGIILNQLLSEEPCCIYHAL